MPGELRLQSSGAGGEVYRETITNNGADCVTGGEITLTRQGERVIWVWSGQTTDAPEISAVAVLFAMPGM